MERRTFWTILAALALLRLALMATVPVFEPSEARYAAISANMARSGDFVVPRFTHDLEYQSFDGKPPLVFQAGGLFCRALGVSEFAVRLFPFLSAALLLLILHSSVTRRADAATGRLAVIICATSTAFLAAAGISMTDMTLACCVAGALLLYRDFLDGFAWRHAAGVAALLGAGMITKGPVALALFGLPVLADAILNRRARGILNVRWLAVAPIFLLVAVPWFVLVEQRNPGSVWYFFYNENFMRFISHDYGDKYGAGREAFRGVSIVWAFVVTLPWALVVVGKLWSCGVERLRSWRFWKELPGRALRTMRESFEWLAFAVIVGFWCLTSRVLLYYLFPVIALFAAAMALRGNRARLVRLAPFAAGISAAVVAGALIGGAFLSDRMLGVRTPLSPVENHYAYEFYHGRPTDEMLAPYRKARALYLEQRAARHAAAARRAGGGDGKAVAP